MLGFAPLSAGPLSGDVSSEGLNVYLYPTNVQVGADVWLRDPTQISIDVTFPALTLVAGVLIQNPSAGAASLKIYISPAGVLIAKTSAGADKLVNLVAGQLIAA